jgi:hypothetical protein
VAGRWQWQRCLLGVTKAAGSDDKGKVRRRRDLQVLFGDGTTGAAGDAGSLCAAQVQDKDVRLEGTSSFEVRHRGAGVVAKAGRRFTLLGTSGATKRFCTRPQLQSASPSNFLFSTSTTNQQFEPCPTGSSKLPATGLWPSCRASALPVTGERSRGTRDAHATKNCEPLADRPAQLP